MSDILRLVIANERAALPIVRLVVGGLATLTDLSLEQLEELQLAVETSLSRAVAPDVEVQLSFAVRERSVEVTILPVTETALDAADDPEPLSLLRILGRLVEVAEVVPHEGGSSLRLERRLGEPVGSAG
jgi:hypothetical protein